MRLRVGENTYDLADALAHPKLRDLKYLSRESRRLDGHAVNPRTLQDMFLKFAESDAADMFSDENVQAQITGLVWLARRHAGEDLSYEDADDFDITTLGFEVEDSDEVEAPKDGATGDLV